MSSFIICFYATANTPYVDVAHEYIINSVAELGLPAHYEVVNNLGSWNKNTSYKPTFAKTMLELYKDKNVVLVDVDARIVQYPELFNLIPEEYNIGAHILDGNAWYNTSYNRKELLTGTLFLRNTPRTMYLVKQWESLCQARQDVWEQMVLKEVLHNNSEEVYELPLSYCYINSLPDGTPPTVKCDNPVVIHYQASRKLKRIIPHV